MQMLTIKHKSASLYQALLCSICCVLFAWFIPYPFPQQIIAFSALIGAAFIVSISMDAVPSLFKKPFSGLWSARMLIFNTSGLLMGMIAALYYRHSYGMLLFPQTFKSFTLVAMAIAVTEELVFRGFIQGRLSNINPAFAIVSGAVAHVAYKAALFLSPFALQEINVVSLILFSLPAIILLGALKHYSKSIVPSIVAHVTFDVLVYAEITHAPWWVW